MQGRRHAVTTFAVFVVLPLESVGQSTPTNNHVATTSENESCSLLFTETYFRTALAFVTTQNWCNNLITTVNSYAISADKHEQFRIYDLISPVLGRGVTVFGYT